MKIELKKIEYVASSIPILFLVFCIVFWLLYSLSLGDWVKPSMNDPKDYFYGIPLMLAMFLMVLSFAIFPFVVYLTIKKSKLHIVVYAVSMFVAIAFFQSDLMFLGEWLGD